MQSAGSREPEISIVIPAHNEQSFLPKCLEAISSSAQNSGRSVETVVVLNRCTDGTKSIALEYGAKVVREDAKNIARIRNAGVRASSAPIVATVDADSYMAPGTITEVMTFLEDPKVLAGGADFRGERQSLAIRLSFGIAKRLAKQSGGSMGLYWFRREAFDAIEGFDEDRHIGEEIDFSSRLRAHAVAQGKRYEMLKRSRLVTSCRKFDEFGDWYAFKLFFFHGSQVKAMAQGNDPEGMDKYYYEPNREYDTGSEPQG